MTKGHVIRACLLSCILAAPAAAAAQFPLAAFDTVHPDEGGAVDAGIPSVPAASS